MPQSIVIQMLCVSTIYTSSIVGGVQSSECFYKPPATSWNGCISPLWTQLIINSDILVQKLYTHFRTLMLRHTYVNTKNVINMQIYC